MADFQDSDDLTALQILQAPANERFDRLIRAAAAAFGCGHGVIALIDGDRVSFKSVYGGTRQEKPRQASYTSLIIESDEPLVITDVWKNPDISRHPAAILAPQIRFVAGQAIHAPNGCRVGAIVIWDTEPHEVSSDQADLLRDFVAQAEWELYRWELVEAQRRLEQSERLYRALFEPNPDAVYVIDTDGCFKSFNDATVRLTLYDRDELIGHRFDAVVVPSDRERANACLRRCLDGEPQYVHLRVRRKDGSQADVSVSMSPYVVGGQLIGAAGISRDITDQVRAEQLLKESEERLMLALEGGEQVVWDWDFPGEHLQASSHSRAVFGYNPDEISGRPTKWQAFIHPDDVARVTSDLRETFRRQGDTLECEFRFRCKDGSYKWVLDRGKVVSYDSDGRPARIIGTLTDIHARKQAEQDRIRQAERTSLAIQAGGVGIFELDLDTGIQTWDGRMLELFGLPLAGVAPSVDQFLRRIHAEDRDRVATLLDGLSHGRQTIDTEYRVELPDGRVRDLRTLGKVLHLADSTQRLLIGTCLDVTDARQLQRQLAHQASHDALTGLPNRFEFERRLEAAVRHAQQSSKEHSVCFIDLDRFKLVNDTAGHVAGDMLLRELGQLLGHQVRSSDLLARLGGDEFGLLLMDCRPEQAEPIAQKLIQAIDTFHFQWDSHVYEISASIGIAGMNSTTMTIAEVMSQADVACYAAKTAGRSRISIYRPEHSDAQQHHRELLLAAGIREALEAGRFCLYAQEIAALGHGDGRRRWELLIRMRDLDGNLVSPATFIPAAERYDLMSHVDRWVLTEALQRHGARLAAIGGLVVSINLSAQSLNDTGFPALMQDLVRTSPLSPDRITFEITETAAVTHLSAASKTMAVLRSAGCTIALDDFGSGLSSFNYLKHFPVDYVKIDGSFIRAMPDSAVDRTIVESIHEVAHKLGSRTVAEYVEDEAILKIAGEVGIDYAQGYAVGRPRPLEEMLDEM